MNGFSLGAVTFLIWITAKGRLSKYIELISNADQTNVNTDSSSSMPPLPDLNANKIAAKYWETDSLYQIYAPSLVNGGQ